MIRGESEATYHILGLPLGLEAPVMTPDGVIFLFFLPIILPLPMTATHTHMHHITDILPTIL